MSRIDDTKASVEQTTSRWGRSPVLGGGTGRLIAVSLLGGFVLAAALAAGATYLGRVTNPDLPSNWNWVFPIIAFAFFLPALFGALWALLVDRETLRGATRNPEQSVEGHWYTSAAKSTFDISLPIIALLAGLFSITRWQVNSGLLLMAVAIGMMLIFVASFILTRRRATR